ncbi:GAF domain-containing sensor histidine kinase [Bradyrhizobium paxllaeri]|uniref:GAF domain-containing sensor histidine kinase n=1 Tax=Bradyrhizobium paxllaeri TaxID=190148 RepID=UPI000A9DF747|nr:GAF domain-containing protein [Bradyrhizobium paxllaeri]
MATLPEDMSVAIDELGSAITEMESHLESARAERDGAKALQAELEIENANLRRELGLAHERQSATSNILKVIASSPSDVQPVFEAIVSSAAKLFEPCSATITTLKDDRLHWSATAASVTGFDVERTRAIYPIPFDPDRVPSARAILERHIIEIPDVAAPDTPEFTRKAAAASGFRSIIYVPLIDQEQGIGTIIFSHPQSGFRFSEGQLAIVQTFADQAVIAIQNARLFNETREALERQTATAEILKVIAGSPSDVQPVFEAIAASAKALLGAFSTTVLRFIGDELHLVAYTPTDPKADEVLQSSFPRPLAEFPTFALVRNGETIQFPDTEADHVPTANKELARLRGFRSVLFTPLMNQGAPVGIISVTRAEPGAFAPHHVQLLQTFADQAVIAIENVRLFNETKEALERQTATADILKVIASSPSDVQPVFDAIADSANRLVGGFSAAVFRYTDGKIHLAAFTPTDTAGDSALQSAFPIPLEKFPPYQLTRKGAPAELTDTELELAARDIARARGYRSMLFAPLMNDGEAVGIITVTRVAPGPFGEQHTRLLQMFADQAVIAIKNVRLFDEVQAKTRDLSEALTYQTGSANILKVIASSPTDLDPVLQSIVESACELCAASDAVVQLRDGDDLRFRAHHGPIEINVEKWPVGRDWAAGRAFLDQATVHVTDVFSEQANDFAGSRELSHHTGGDGVRTVLSVPLLREGESLGALTLRRQEVEPFSDKQIALLQTFADQAVIAIGNVHLFEEVQARTHELSKSLEDLRAAQDRLVQTEKLASLGQLTAGIAHEIKNPLNFVNNFAALSAELTEELNDVLKPTELADKIRSEVDELTGLLRGNLEKVVQHGKRADSIIKNMLLHSREGGGEHRLSDINALVDESLNLAYHGARAEKPGFNVTLERDFDPAAGELDLFPQEITRVILNLVSNGFYAITKRNKEGREAGFEPTLRASTKDLGESVEIRIRDNGTGIPPEVKEKMFNPFFTSKPAGEGTGLGLSMSHDIIVKQHGGTIDVDTQPGHFTEFRIVLPRTSNFAERSKE